MFGPINNEGFKKLLISWREKAILYLYRHYYKRLARASEGRTHDLKASEEIVQDTFLFVYRNYLQLGEDDTLDLNPYLFGIVHKKSIDYYNRVTELKERQHKYYVDINHDNLSFDEELSISVETCIAIWQLIATFPHKERECLILKFLENMTVDEIAERLNVSRKAVEGNTTRAYKRFKDQGSFLYHRK